MPTLKLLTNHGKHTVLEQEVDDSTWLALETTLPSLNEYTLLINGGAVAITQWWFTERGTFYWNIVPADGPTAAKVTHYLRSIGIDPTPGADVVGKPFAIIGEAELTVQALQDLMRRSSS